VSLCYPHRPTTMADQGDPPAGGPAEAPEDPEAPPPAPGGDGPPAAPADPLAAPSEAVSPAPGPGSSDGERRPVAPAAPKPPAKKTPRKAKPKVTVADVVPEDVLPWVEATDVTLLVESLRIDERVMLGQIRGVTEGTVKQVYEAFVKNPPKALCRVTVWRSAEGMSCVVCLTPWKRTRVGSQMLTILVAHKCARKMLCSSQMRTLP
jgi:hypothetical protein